MLDIQRDHLSLIRKAMKKLESGGLLIFSTNKLSFKLDAEVLRKYEVQDYTIASLGKDFQRQKKIHQTWLMRHSQHPIGLR